MRRILTHFLFVFVCRRWVHPVSVTTHPPPPTLLISLCISGIHWLFFAGFWQGVCVLIISSCSNFLPQTWLLFSCSCKDILFSELRYALTFLLGMCGWFGQRLWTVTVGKLSVDIHLACTCICVYVHADLRYARYANCLCVHIIREYRTGRRLRLGTVGEVSRFFVSISSSFFLPATHVRVSNDFLVWCLAVGMCPLSTFSSSLSFL